MTFFARIAALLAAPLLLTGCLFQPGKFTSTLDIGADRSFTFTYVGEIRGVDLNQITDGITPPGDKAAEKADATDDKAKADDSPPSPKPGISEADKAELAVKLRKEAGFRTAEYRGDDVWFVDYRIAGRLTHSFVFPFNGDAKMVFPFLAIEPRANGTVRMTAPGFAQSAQRPDLSTATPGGGNDSIDGEFTLTTDADIVSQSNEEGASAGPDGRKTIRWRITPQTTTAPMAVLRMRD